MLSPTTTRSSLEDILERTEGSLTILSSKRTAPRRRLLYVNSYGSKAAWQLIKEGVYPTHHLWGAVELVHHGYEVGLAQNIGDFHRRRPLPHDFSVVRQAMSWVGRDGIVFCAHNVLFWTAFLKKFGLRLGQLVALLYAREPLQFAEAYSGVLGLTPAATEHARQLAPKAKVAHVGWGADLNFFPVLRYEPHWFFSCGKTHRDRETLIAATKRAGQEVKFVGGKAKAESAWSPQTVLIAEGQADSHIPVPELIRDYYPKTTAALIILQSDPQEETAVGFTTLLEAMAVGRPVIMTRTGALARECDVEKNECGLFVPPNDPAALAEAMNLLSADPARAAAMGRNGRQLCEAHYNADRYAADLHKFFESL